jgi:hypothetical protein
MWQLSVSSGFLAHVLAEVSAGGPPLKWARPHGEAF